MNKQGKTRRFKKRYLVVVLVVVIGAISPFLLQKLREYEGELAGRLLREVVERESKGYYTVTFNEAKLSLLNADIEIDDFRLIPNPKAVNATTPINTFEITIPKVTLTLENLFSILFYKELTIKSVRIVDPEIAMLRTNEPKGRRPFSLEAGDLYSLVSQYLKLFKIEYFQIADGVFNYDKPSMMEDTSAFAISKLNFEARNFQLDSASETLKRVFYTDEIELVINDQSLFLPDGVHQFSFGKLHLSTADQLVRFEKIRVAPRTDLDVSFYENPDLINIYDIAIPSLHLSGIDFLNAYTNNQLHIDSIALDRPSILINDEMAKTNESDNNDNSLTAILINYFDEVYIRSANITKAKMNLHLIANGKGRGVKLENASIRLGEFRVDSTFFGTGVTNREYFQDIELSFDNYKANLPDSVHQIFVKHFKLSSFDNLIEIDSFRSYVRTDMEIKGTPDKYEIYLPEVGLTHFDWHAIANYQEADFGKFYMDQPEVRVHKYTANQGERREGKLDMNAVMADLNPYAELISFDSIAVDNGLFHWIEDDEELLGLEHVQVDITGFHIDEDALERKDRFLFSDEIALSFSDFDIETPDRTHVITVDEFAINSLDQEMHINNIVIRPIHQQSIKHDVSLRGKIDRVSFEGISFLNMLHEEHYMFDRISLLRPQLDIDKSANQTKKVRENKVFPDWIDFVNVGRFDIRNGLIRYAQDGEPMASLGRYDLSVSNFSLDSVLLSKDKINHTMDNLTFGGQSLTVHLPEIDHAVKIKSLNIDQAQGRLSMNQIELSPLHEDDSLSRYDVFSDKIVLEGFDMERAFLDNEWRITNSYIHQPKVNLSLVPDPSKSPQEFDVDQLYQSIGEKLKLLSIGSFSFDSGGLVLQQGERLIEVPTIDFSLDDFEVTRGGVRDTSMLLFAKDYSLTLTDPYFSLPQLDDSVHVKKIRLVSSGKQLILDSVYFASGQNRDNQIEVKLPQLSMTWLGLPQLLDQRKLHVQSIDFKNPQISYAQSKEGDGDGLPQTLPLDLLGINEVAIDSFNIEGTTFGYRNSSQDEMTGLDLRNLNITVVRLKADTTSQIDDQRLFWNEDIILSGSSLEYFITDSLNKIEIGGYRTSLREKRLTLTDIKMNPTLDQDAYAIAFGEQTDWINASIDSIDLNGINWRALLFDKKVDISSAKVKGVEMSVYRDKRIPRGEERFRGLPHKNLQEMDRPIEVDQFDLVDGKIIYTEHVLESSSPGTMAFTDLNASFYNLVNTPEALSRNEILNINASTQLMGHGELTLNATANLKDEKGSFLVVGKLDKMDLTELNRMMEHVAFVKIRSGVNNKMEFSVEANEDFALGEMKFFYEDLKISMISKKDESEKGMGPALGSFFANAFIINSNNPRWLFVRDGNIFYERNTKRSIFNYLSKSVLSGVVSSIGARSNKRDIKRKNKEAIQQLKEQRKEDKMLEERVGVYE